MKQTWTDVTILKALEAWMVPRDTLRPAAAMSLKGLCESDCYRKHLAVIFGRESK